MTDFEDNTSINPTSLWILPKFSNASEEVFHKLFTCQNQQKTLALKGSTPFHKP